MDDFTRSIALTPVKLRADGIYFHQGMCYWSMGASCMAVEIWELSLSAPYADAVRGIEAIALFLYAGLCLKDQEIIKKARHLISRF